MISSILKAYGIPSHDCTVEPLVSGLINKTLKISTGNQVYILQRINNNVFKSPKDIAENIRMIDKYLKLNNPDYLFVSPVRNLQNEELVHDPVEGYFRLFPFIIGTHTINVVTSPDQAFEAALQFGKFTRLLSGFDSSKLHNTIPDFHNLSLRHIQFEDSLKGGDPDRIKQAKPLIDDLKEYRHILNTFERIQKNKCIKKRVTHHDTKISNVLFDDQEKGVAVIDLDTVMAGYFISDMGDMMRTYLSPANEEERDFSKIEVREDYFHAIVHGYIQYMGDELTEEEHDLILYSGLFLIYMQAIRFLADHCNKDSYYGASYEGQNFVRAGNQICLLKKLAEKENLLQGIIHKELQSRSRLLS